MLTNKSYKDVTEFILSDNMRNRITYFFGHSFDGLKIFISSKLKKENVLGTAQGDVICLTEDYFNFSDFLRDWILGHELTHIHQQALAYSDKNYQILNSEIEAHYYGFYFALKRKAKKNINKAKLILRPSFLSKKENWAIETCFNRTDFEDESEFLIENYIGKEKTIDQLKKTLKKIYDKIKEKKIELIESNIVVGKNIEDNAIKSVKQYIKELIKLVESLQGLMDALTITFNLENFKIDDFIKDKNFFDDFKKGPYIRYFSDPIENFNLIKIEKEAKDKFLKVLINNILSISTRELEKKILGLIDDEPSCILENCENIRNSIRSEIVYYSGLYYLKIKNSLDELKEKFKYFEDEKRKLAEIFNSQQDGITKTYVSQHLLDDSSKGCHEQFTLDAAKILKENYNINLTYKDMSYLKKGSTFNDKHKYNSELIIFSKTDLLFLLTLSPKTELTAALIYLSVPHVKLRLGNVFFGLNYVLHTNEYINQSHHGYMQFLHSMNCSSNTKENVNKVLRWIEFCLDVYNNNTIDCGNNVTYKIQDLSLYYYLKKILDKCPENKELDPLLIMLCPLLVKGEILEAIKKELLGDNLSTKSNEELLKIFHAENEKGETEKKLKNIRNSLQQKNEEAIRKLITMILVEATKNEKRSNFSGETIGAFFNDDFKEKDPTQYRNTGLIALGSASHMLQDSFCQAHSKRIFPSNYWDDAELKKKCDQEHFPPRKISAEQNYLLNHISPILLFADYTCQDSDDHSPSDLFVKGGYDVTLFGKEALSSTKIFLYMAMTNKEKKDIIDFVASLYPTIKSEFQEVITKAGFQYDLIDVATIREYNISKEDKKYHFFNRAAFVGAFKYNTKDRFLHYKEIVRNLIDLYNYLELTREYASLQYMVPSGDIMDIGASSSIDYKNIFSDENSYKAYKQKRINQLKVHANEILVQIFFELLNRKKNNILIEEQNKVIKDILTRIDDNKIEEQNKVIKDILTIIDDNEKIKQTNPFDKSMMDKIKEILSHKEYNLKDYIDTYNDKIQLWEV